MAESMLLSNANLHDYNGLMMSDLDLQPLVFEDFDNESSSPIRSSTSFDILSYIVGDDYISNTTITTDNINGLFPVPAPAPMNAQLINSYNHDIMITPKLKHSVAMNGEKDEGIFNSIKAEPLDGNYDLEEHEEYDEDFENPSKRKRAMVITRSYSPRKSRRTTPKVYKRMYIGVTYHPNSNKFRARIKVDGRTTHLGYFDSELEAALAYDRACYELRGDSAVLNYGKSDLVIGYKLPEELSSLPMRERCKRVAESAFGAFSQDILQNAMDNAKLIST